MKWNASNLVEQTLLSLSWDRFTALAAEQTKSEPGKKLIQELINPTQWSQSLAQAKTLQLETKEALILIDRDGLWTPLQGLMDPEPLYVRLEKGGYLEISELVLLRAWIYAFDSWGQFPRDGLSTETFKNALTQLSNFSCPLRHLEKILTPQGELSEKASPKLSGLTQDIRELKKQIQQTLEQLLKTFSQKGVLQENFYDLRDGRYVIPIKISSQNEIDGIIYEASVSRQTVFVEPKEVAPLNNRLRQRENDLLQEIVLIMREAAEQLRPEVSELRIASTLLIHWDAVQAKARLGRKYGGKPIDVQSDRSFFLKRTTHPLLFWSLQPDQVIHNHIEFEDPLRTLLITGPNTGGKTVFLKTLGLAALCARTGFTFPATELPKVPYFNSIFADLGDSQSIESHLSSFSGHILRFKQILEEATDESLVLLDELNTATDPEEGAALGRAFLESLMSRGSMIVSTTHDPHLKALALHDPRILNASMAFDESARAPTFQILLGVPGRSRALETAERLGIPKQVLDLAKTFLNDNHRQFQDMITQLQSNVEIATHARKEAQHQLQEAERIKTEWVERTESKVSEAIDRTRQRLKRLIDQAQDQVREAVKKLDETKSRREVDQVRATLNQSLTETTERIEHAFKDEAPETSAKLETIKSQISGAKKLQNPPITHFDLDETQTGPKTGDLVRVPKWKSIGTIVNRLGNRLKVSLGTLQVQLTLDDVHPLTASELKAFPIFKSKVQRSSSDESSQSISEQIDLRGIRFDEAMSDLERYVDQAFRSKRYTEVRIIHGLGTGAIREGARDLFKKLPYIKAVRDAGSGQGGTGATIVEFDY